LEVVSSLVVSTLFPPLVVQTMIVSLLCSRLFEMGACFPWQRRARNVATQTLGGNTGNEVATQCGCNEVATQCGGNDEGTQTDFWLQLEPPEPPLGVPPPWIGPAPRDPLPPRHEPPRRRPHQ